MKHFCKVHSTPIVAAPVQEFRPTTVVRNGHAVKILEIVSVSPQDTLGALHAEDYELDNILAIGATDMLRPMSLSRDNLEADMASVQAFDAAVSAAQKKTLVEAPKSAAPADTPPAS